MASEHAVYLSDGWEIDFGGEYPQARIEAEGDVLCPQLGARWVHTALLGLDRGTHEVVGFSPCGVEYFKAAPVAARGLLETRRLPELPVIRSSGNWDDALHGPLGPALKRAWEEEA